MARKWFQSLTGLLASAGLALAQPPATPPTLPAEMPAVPPPGAVTEGNPLISAPAAGCTSCGPAETVWDTGTCAPHAGGAYVGNGWFTAEYLYWEVRDQKVVPLAGTVPGVLAIGGELPPGAINPLFGGDATRIDYGHQNGIRLSAGRWMSDDYGVDVSGFFLEEASLDFFRRTFLDPVVGPVFADPVAGRDIIIVPSDRTLQTSTVSINADNMLWGGEINVRRKGCALLFADRLEFFTGARYLQFDESLNVYSAIEALPGTGAFSAATFDNFNVHNRWYGWQFGFTSKWYHNGWFIHNTGKLGLGVIHHDATVNGGTSIAGPGVGVGLPGGVLAQPTNSGRFDRARFSVLPEWTINVGYEFGSGLRAFVGYNFLYVSDVVRAGTLIDAVDGRQVPTLRFPDPVPPGVVRPRHDFQEGRFWVQGINAGLEFRY